MLKTLKVSSDNLYEKLLSYFAYLGHDRDQVREGSMPESSLKALSYILTGNGLQIGGFVGLTHVFLATALKGKGSICTVDFNQIHRGIVNPALTISKAIDFFNVSSNSILIIGDSNKQMKLFEKCNFLFDFILLDGNHDKENVLREIFLADKILNSDGYLVLDDIDYWEGPRSVYANFPLNYKKIPLDARAGLLKKP